ncbi:MAG: DUF5794 domain-containing protein [Halodesulfurarchaeum sp.]
MSSSRHPIALRLEQQVGGATKLLATVMLLPLVDGIFPALVLADALDSWVGIMQVGLLVFGGSATLAVLLVEMDTDRTAQFTSVIFVGIPLVLVAAIEAAFAPTIASFIDVLIFERFAALVLVAIAAKTASATIGEYLPRPSVIIGLGAVASLDLSAFSITITTEPGLILRAATAGLVGVVFAMSVVALRPYIKDNVDIDRFRFGTAIALGTLALSIINVVPSQAPLPVFAVAGLLAFDPSDTPDPIEMAQSEPEATPDGGDDSVEGFDVDTADPGRDYPGDVQTDDRAPWL